MDVNSQEILDRYTQGVRDFGYIKLQQAEILKGDFTDAYFADADLRQSRLDNHFLSS